MKNRQTPHWLNVAEYTALAGVGVGSVLSAFAQQFVYATAPLSVAVLLEMANRQRLQAQQAQATKRQLNDLKQVSQGITALSEHLQVIPAPQTIAILEQAVGQQQEALNEAMAYVNTTYATLGKRLAEFESQDSHRDIAELKAAHSSIQTLLTNLQASLKEMTTREHLEATERAIATVQQKVRHLDGQLEQLGEQTTPKLEALQEQVEQLLQPAAPVIKEPDFNEAKLNEIVNLMADLVPRRDWNTVTAQLQALQRQYSAQAERDQQLASQIHELQRQLPDETEDSLAALHHKWQGLLETVQDKVQALPDLAELESVLQEMLQRRLQTFPKQALPHQLLVDLPATETNSDAATTSQAGPDQTSSRVALESALQTATGRVILTWPWASSYQLDSQLAAQFDRFLSAGKTLHLGWCSAHSRQQSPLLASIRRTWNLDPTYAARRATLQYLLQLKQRYPEHLHIRLLGSDDNFLIIDREQAVIGLDPPLLPAADTQPLRLKVRTTSRSVVDSLIEQYRHDRAAGLADTLWRQAMAQYDLGDRKRAIAKLEALVAEAPDGAVYNLLGVLQQAEGNPDAARDAFGQAVDRAPADGVPYCNRGVLRYQHGDLAGAIADLDQAMGLMPVHLPLFYRGRCWEAMERYEQAAEDYSRVLAAVPDMPVVLWRRAAAYQKLGQMAQAQQDVHSAAWAFEQQHNVGAARRCLQQLDQWEQAAAASYNPLSLHVEPAPEHVAS